MTMLSYRSRIGACCVVLAGLGVAACKSDSTNTETVVAQTVVIIGEDNTQSKVLTEMYALALKKSGFRVVTRNPIADLPAGYAALNAGAADLFVTHTGELLAFLAANEPAAQSTSTTEQATTTTLAATTTTAAETEGSTAGTDSDTTAASADTTTGDTTDDTATGDIVTIEESTTTTISTAGQAAGVSINLQRNLIGEILPAALQTGAPSNAEDKPIIACVATVSTGISNLSDVSRAAAGLRIAGPADFETGDPFGLVGFENTFDATFKSFVPVAQDKVAAAMGAAADTAESTTTTVAETGTDTTLAPEPPRDADCGAFNSLDPTISTQFVVMDDDVNWIENNGVIPLLTTAALSAGVSQVVDQVTQAITTDALRLLIKSVDDGVPAGRVVTLWLSQNGIIS